MVRNKTVQGFTLIEVLIALTLLSLMVVLLFSSMRICADSWEKGENRIAEVDEIAVVYNFFQRHLSSSRPLWNDFDGDEKVFSFQGKPESLQFVSAFPASVGKPGPQLFSIFLQQEDRDPVIKVALTPFFPAAEDQESTKEEVTLVSHVSEFSFEYFGSEDGFSEGVWQNEWLDKQTQPKLVKIHIGLKNGMYWPDMIIELKVANDATINANNANELEQDGLL
jgi:general secretion pathway protein J